MEASTASRAAWIGQTQPRDPNGAHGRTKADAEEALKPWLGGSERCVVPPTRWRLGQAGQYAALSLLRRQREQGEMGQGQGSTCLRMTGTFAT